MSVFQFLRILWAYRMIVLATTAACFAVAVVFVQLATPVYEAQSRVMLDVVKPDPVTGQVMPTPFLRAYTKTQIELVQDTQVARRVVEDLNWRDDPAIQKWYREREDGSRLDLPTWASEQIVEGTSARLIEGSNILEITHRSNSPVRARVVAEGLRKAYMDMALQSRQETARRNADWYEAQAEKARGLLMRAEKTKADYERETGIVLQDDKLDVDTARLSALAQQGAAPVVAPSSPAVASATAIQLAQSDAELAQASKVFGPNHPQLQEMRRKRELLAAQVAQERAAAGSASAAAISAANATNAMLEAQKAKVMGQREKVERLGLMQDEVNLRREQYRQAALRAAQLRQEAEIAVTGVTPLGAAVTPQGPVFPNKPLVVSAALPVGFALGLIIGLVLEFAGQRIRGAEDLGNAVGAPVLGVVQPRERKRGWSWSRIVRPGARLRPQPARS